jgi:GTP-binding protein
VYGKRNSASFDFNRNHASRRIRTGQVFPPEKKNNQQSLIKEINGIRHEPVETLTVQVPENFAGKVIDHVTQRKGDILNIDLKNDRARLDFKIPSRGIIGLRNQLLTATEGEAVIAHRFECYEPWKGEMAYKRNGSLIAIETGTSVS